MKWNPSKWPILSISGVSVIVLYCVFTFTSYALYPSPFSPLTNYLSRLGDYPYNPSGAVFYNLGCILTGLALFPFYLGLFKWYTKETWRKELIIAAQVIGMCSAFALMMIGVFSEDTGKPHLFWSGAFFTLNFIVLILVNTALITRPKFMKAIGLYGYTVTILSLVLSLLSDSIVSGSIVEWFTVFSALGFVGLLVYNTFKLGHIK
ncbi:MAG: DUF998 domain-containing protein [Candidatus Atabeyarchaeum deiterrae]